MTTLRRPLAVLLVALALGACGGDDDSDDAGAGESTAASSTTLEGLLAIAPGACDAALTGSWFRMVQPGGDAASGPFVENGDSPCADKGVTPLAPGSEGGLRLGDYQPQPDPPFGADGGSLSTAVISPVTFFAVGFGVSTNPTDPQTGADVPAPSLAVEGDTVTGDLSAISVSWNGQHFNQGTPKPGAAGAVTGTFDDATGAYTLEWTSLIEGGPFNGFTGVWHLEGTLETA